MFMILSSLLLKVQLSEGDIETILNTLVFDGKAEMSLVADSNPSVSSSNGQKKLFRVLKPLLPVTGLMRTPCGVCPVRELSSCGLKILLSKKQFWTDTSDSTHFIVCSGHGETLNFTNKNLIARDYWVALFFNL